MRTNIPVEKVFKKYMKPQIVIGERYVKLGFKCWIIATILVWLLKLIGAGQWPSIEDLFAQFLVSAFTCLWFTIFPLFFIGGFKRYFAFRKQILEDDEVPVKRENTLRVEGDKKESVELIKLQRSIESLAVNLSLLQQQVAQIENSLRDKQK